MKIKIGKAEDNDFIVNDPHVSRHHACLVREDHGCWLLEDLGSTNGTFVNGSQIVKKRITPTDKIILGTGYVLNLTEALKYNNDYSEEFAALKKVYDDYVQEKVKIQSATQFKTRLLQSLPFALPGVIGGVIGFLGKGILGYKFVYNYLCPDDRHLPGCKAGIQDSSTASGYCKPV